MEDVEVEPTLLLQGDLNEHFCLIANLNQESVPVHYQCPQYSVCKIFQHVLIVLWRVFMISNKTAVGGVHPYVLEGFYMDFQ